MSRNSNTEGYSLSPAGTRSEWRRRLLMLGRTKTALFGTTFLLVLVLAAVTADWIAPYDPNEQVLQDRLLPPTWSEDGVHEHILGTDHLGRDILSRMIYGSRVSLTVGILAVAISGVLGVGLGLMAGYYGGLGDTIIMRVLDVQLAFPFVLLALAIVAVLGPNLRNVIIVLGVAGWMAYARVVRGQVLSIKENEFVEAARCVGVKSTRIILRHILPNTLASVIVIATFAVATNILLEASLTFLGVGVQSRIPTWGSMLSDGRSYVATAWWLTAFPGLIMMLTLLSINMMGDWVRDAFDPHLRHL